MIMINYRNGRCEEHQPEYWTLNGAGSASILNVPYLEPGLLLTRCYTAPWHLRSRRLRNTSVETEDVVDVIIAISGDAGDVGAALLAEGSETTVPKMGANVASCGLVTSSTWKQSPSMNGLHLSLDARTAHEYRQPP